MWPHSPNMSLIAHSYHVSLLPFSRKLWSVHPILLWLSLTFRKISQPMVDWARKGTFNLFCGVWHVVSNGDGGSEGMFSGSPFGGLSMMVHMSSGRLHFFIILLSLLQLSALVSYVSSDLHLRMCLQSSCSPHMQQCLVSPYHCSCWAPVCLRLWHIFAVFAWRVLDNRLSVVLLSPPTYVVKCASCLLFFLYHVFLEIPIHELLCQALLPIVCVLHSSD
jgi:hypothetical protein